MIIVALKGGLGNQMFQYALGRTLAERNKDTLKLDLSALVDAHAHGNIPRDFGLQHFEITASIATPAEITAVQSSTTSARLISRFKTKIFGDNTVRFNQNILTQTGDLYLNGYYQSPRYFESIKEIILKEFQLKTPPRGDVLRLVERIAQTNAVSLHVRRGDYVENRRVTREFGICSIEYYIRAITEMKKRVTNPTFFIFSDDINWAQAHLPLKETSVFISGHGLTPANELFLMSQCQHNIIANSSFSWWAAWLNQHKEKNVIAPTPWFNVTAYDKNLLPESWIQLAK